MKTECEAVFLFIAELTGSYVAGTGTVQTKIDCGKQDYINNHLPDIDLDVEVDRKDLHENVWLERLYAELDRYFLLENSSLEDIREARALTILIKNYSCQTYKWSVPIELDFSASMLQYMGLLLNDSRLLNMTNVTGDTLEDPWKLEGMSRFMLKKAATPMLYGSTQACHELWQDNSIAYTPEDIALYGKEMANGMFGLCNLFKEFIINNAKPKAEMMVNINGEEFTVSCNRFRNVGEKTKAYKVWDSVDKRYNVVLHTDTKKIPDLKRFRRYFITLLIHNLDSQVADAVGEKLMAKYGWGLTIHDALICSPAAALDVRMWAAMEYEEIHKNRKTILKNYFNSIGITSASQSQWEDLTKKIHQFEGELEVSLMCLK
jgi:hypothetical protein